MSSRRILCRIILLVLASRSAAAQICVSASAPLASTNWSHPIVLPRFDAALGALQSVRIEMSAHIEGSAAVENVDPSALQVDLFLYASFKLTRPSGTFLLVASPLQQTSVGLSAYDGVVDFGGTSGASFQHLAADTVPAPSTLLTSGLDLGLFTGPAGNPGTVTLGLDAVGRSYAMAAASQPEATFRTLASSTISVCYDYEPVLTSYCAGNGAGTACPCGNDSEILAGAGCLNSTGFGGHLHGSGAARVGADTFVLTADFLPSGTTALFVQGTTRVNGGMGTVFGDGLRCVGGTVVRLAQKSAVGASVDLPQGAGPRISVIGIVQAGDLREYQVWYRNLPNFCAIEAFNLTQALEVRWAP